MSWEDRDGARWIRLAGELDNPAITDMRARFDETVDRSGDDIVVDMDGVTFVTSVAVGMLIDTKERLKDTGRRLRLTGINSKVRNAFSMMALGDVFEEL